jgi:hypothetical protein
LHSYNNITHWIFIAVDLPVQLSDLKVQLRIFTKNV